MTEEEWTVKSSISEELRLALQSSLIEQHGKYFKCEKCGETYHLLDLKEQRFKLNEDPVLGYLCRKCNFIVVRVTT